MCETTEQLVKASLAGDRKAYNQLVNKNYRKVVAVASRLLSNLDDGLEVAQMSFVRVYQALGQLKEVEQFDGWLMKIVVNQALDYRRKRFRHRTLSLSESPDRDSEGDGFLGVGSVASKEPGSLEQLMAKELEAELSGAIEALPDNLRVPLMLFSLEKISQKEIAEMLDCSLQSVKWSVFEARRRLRERLKDRL